MGYKFTAASSMALTGSDTGFPSGSANRTIAVWFRTTTTGVTAALISYGSAGTGNGCVIGLNTSNNVFVSNYGGSQSASGLTVTGGNWILGILTVNGTTWGAEAYNSAGQAATPGSGGLTTNTTLGGTLYVGRDPWGPEYFTGDIARVAIWNVLLLGKETISLSNGTPPNKVRPASLVGYWELEGLLSPEPDLSGNKNPLTLVNTPVISTSNPPVWRRHPIMADVPVAAATPKGGAKSFVGNIKSSKRKVLTVGAESYLVSGDV